jgi:deazaflavin-dependent oxidoreductase (nitroreductase family)
VLSGGLARSYRGLLFWWGQQSLCSWLGPRLFAPIDTWLYPRVHGTVVSAGPAVLPLLMLTTRSRTSRQPRSVPLLYCQLGDEIIVVGSNWGQPKHPAWSDNLLAEPDGVVQIGKATFSVTARLLEGEEKARIWPELTTYCPVWQRYQERSGRDLRVFVLNSPERFSRRV